MLRRIDHVVPSHRIDANGCARIDRNVLARTRRIPRTIRNTRSNLVGLAVGQCSYVPTRRIQRPGVAADHRCVGLAVQGDRDRSTILYATRRTRNRDRCPMLRRIDHVVSRNGVNADGGWLHLDGYGIAARQCIAVGGQYRKHGICVAAKGKACQGMIDVGLAAGKGECSAVVRSSTEGGSAVQGHMQVATPYGELYRREIAITVDNADAT